MEQTKQANSKTEQVVLEVEGMDCNNCAASIEKYLQRQGLEEVFVSFQTKEVRFRRSEADPTVAQTKQGIRQLGYTIADETSPLDRRWTLERMLWLCAFPTALLLGSHIMMAFGYPIGALADGWVQFMLAVPVFLIGGLHFGRSALASLRAGIPNMDVLIFIGSTAALVYSLIGLWLNNPNYYFFETSATIITLVLMGNWLEQRAVAQTTSAIEDLAALQADRAKRILPSGLQISVEASQLRPGHLVQVNTGDRVPADGNVMEGEADLDESMLTGESQPVAKGVGAEVIGGSIVRTGQLRLRVTATGHDTVLQQMIELVKTAQQDKPAIQRLADQISAIFVPVVLGISLLTFSLGYGVFGLSAQQALLNAIAVLVISCPCAMGLATPTAVMVGVGRLARQGVLIRGGQTVELLARLRRVVFDKTGTLTTGKFRVTQIEYPTGEEAIANHLLYHIEQRSSHPIAEAIVAELADRQNGVEVALTEIQEHPGRGMEALDAEGHQYRIDNQGPTDERGRSAIFLHRDATILARLELQDDLKSDAATAIQVLKAQGIEPQLLSGDREAKTAAVAQTLGIDHYLAEQLPDQKLARIEALSAEAPTAMVGDGINDAPALARATVGISVGGASQVALQSAQVVLLKGRLDRLPTALHISRQTVQTIRQNLFWAFAYNVVAIPMAAMGFLNPMWGALFMAFSDVIVIGNSVRLKYRK